MENDRSRSLLKKSVLLAILFSLAIFLAFHILDSLYLKNGLPFGFSYEYTDGREILRGQVPLINPQELEREIKAKNFYGTLILRSSLYSPKNREWIFHVSGSARFRLYVNGRLIDPDPKKVFSPMALQRGANGLKLVFSNRQPGPWDFEFSFFEQTYIPFTQFFWQVLPDSSFSRILSGLLRTLNTMKSWGLIAAALLLMILLGIEFIKREKSKPVPLEPSFFYLALKFSFAATAVALLILHLGGNLKIKIPNLLIATASLLVAGLTAQVYRFRIKLKGRVSRDQAVVLVIVVAAVLCYVFLVSGRILPLEPIGGVDLYHHMAMIKNFQHHGTFFYSLEFPLPLRIYPQATHALIGMTAALLGCQAEELLTLFQIVTTSGLLFGLYLVTRQLFGRLHFSYFLLALSLAYLPYALRHQFEESSFPAFAAIFLFIFALYFFLRRDPLVSALTLAAALTVYPYFVFVFAGVMFLFAVEDNRRRGLKVWRSAVGIGGYFSFSILVMALYVWLFVTQGVPAQREGFLSPYALNPFFSLKIINSVFFILALLFILMQRRYRPAAILALGLLGGFLCYYVPYYFFSSISNYYIQKIILFLIFAITVFVAFTLHQLLERIGSRPGVKATFVVLALCFSFFRFQLWFDQKGYYYPEGKRISMNMMGKPYQGVTAACRWLRRNCPSGCPILFLTKNEFIRNLLQTYLGESFQVNDLEVLAKMPVGAPILVLSEVDFPLNEFPYSLQPIYAYKDFRIFRMRYSSPIGNKAKSN